MFNNVIQKLRRRLLQFLMQAEFELPPDICKPQISSTQSSISIHRNLREILHDWYCVELIYKSDDCWEKSEEPYIWVQARDYECFMSVCVSTKEKGASVEYYFKDLAEATMFKLVWSSESS